MRLTVLLTSCLMLSACGFTLRGTAELPASLQPLYLENSDSGTAMSRELLRVFTNNQIILADKKAVNSYSLEVGNDTSSERPISVNANARAGEYEIDMTIPFQLRRGATVVLGPENLSLTKVYLADPGNAVAKNDEAELIRTEMRRELAQQILRRLQAFAPQ